MSAANREPRASLVTLSLDPRMAMSSRYAIRAYLGDCRVRRVVRVGVGVGVGVDEEMAISIAIIIIMKPSKSATVRSRRRHQRETAQSLSTEPTQRSTRLAG